MIHPKPKNEQEQKKYHRESYEVEKNDLTYWYKSQGDNMDGLNRFLTNSLVENYETELREDGILEESTDK